MQFALNEDARLASAAARDLFRELGDADREAVARGLKDGGWFDVTRDGGPIVGVLAAEQAGWSGLAFPFSEQALAAPAALASAVSDGYSPPATEPGRVAPAAVSAAVDGLRGREPLRAARLPAGWAVSGTAWPVVATSGVAQWLAVATSAGSGEPCLFAVPRGKVEAMSSLDPAVEVWRVDFEGVVAAAERLPTRALQSLVDWGAAGAAAEMLGAAQRLLEMSIEHAKQRIQFGHPVGGFQAVKHHCANMHVLVEAMRASVWGAAEALASDSPPSEAVSVAKSYCGTAAKQVAKTSLQVHGGIGFTWEHPLHRHLKRIERLTSEFGDARWHRARLLASVEGVT